MAFKYINSNISELHPIIRSSHEQDSNCTVHEIEEFLNWFTYKPPRYDIVIICLIITLYTFYALAILCDDFCVPSLEKICIGLGMSYNVAGATILAFLTSTPEFCVHLYATFITEGEMGIGTIVGSAVFNAVAITAVCGLYAGRDGLYLDWWPITRDVLWYLLSMSILTVLLYDGRIMLYEAALLVSIFVVNVTLTLLDTYVQRIRNPKRICPCLCFVPPGKVADFEINYADPLEENEEDQFSFKRWTSKPSCSKKILWILSYPLQCLFFITIPNIKKPWKHNYAVLTLIMSAIWIGILSYIVTWMLTVIGLQLFLPSSLMGLTLLAAGTGVPEAVSAVIVTKKGYGSMAACASVASNSFGILFCLGLPWLIKCFMRINNPTINYIVINSHAIVQDTIALFVSTCAMYCTLMLGRFRLNMLFGLFCLFLYMAYVIITVAIETSEYTNRSRNICDIDFK